LIISSHVFNTPPINLGLERIFRRTKEILNRLDQVQFLHVLRENNREVDEMENLETLLIEGMLRVNNGQEKLEFIP